MTHQRRLVMLIYGTGFAAVAVGLLLGGALQFLGL